MTENERVLRDIIIDGNGFDYDESIPQSIFEEIQQYRAIGTVEECEKAMDFELAKQDKMLAEVIDDYLKYIKIGTIEEFKDLKEKSFTITNGKWIDTQPEYSNGYYKNVHVCSNCSDYYTTEYDEMNFCPKCGAKMTET